MRASWATNPPMAVARGGNTPLAVHDSWLSSLASTLSTSMYLELMSVASFNIFSASSLFLWGCETFITQKTGCVFSLGPYPDLLVNLRYFQLPNETHFFVHAYRVHRDKGVLVMWRLVKSPWPRKGCVVSYELVQRQHGNVDLQRSLHFCKVSSEVLRRV